GEGTGTFFVEDKQEFAKLVREKPGSGPSIETGFQYDYREALTNFRVKTTVRDPRGNDTLYVMNTGGGVLETHEPQGKNTFIEWATDDVLKMKETDAKQRFTRYEYDSRGNLTLESIQAPGLGVVETHYEYDPRFNKMTLKRDPEQRTTSYDIDS